MSVDTRPPVARSAGWKAVELPRPLSFAFRGGDDGSTSKFAATDEAVQSRLRVGGDHRSSNSRTGGARVDAVHKIKGNEENGANCPVACLGERGRVRIKKNGWPLLLFTMGAGVSYMFTHYNVQAYMGYRKGVFNSLSEAVARGTFDALLAGIKENSIATSLEEIGTLLGVYYTKRDFVNLAQGFLSYNGNTTSLAYLPRVRQENLSEYLEFARGVYPGLAQGDYYISQGNPEGGLMPRLNTTDDFWPLLYQEPLNSQILGFDVYSEPVRRNTVDEVLASFSAKATEAVLLADTGLPGIIYFQPVMRDGGVEGLVGKVLRVTPVVAEVVATRKFFDAMPQANIRLFLRIDGDRVQQLHDNHKPVEEIWYTGSLPDTKLGSSGTWSVTKSLFLTETKEAIVVLSAIFEASWILYVPLFVGCLLSLLLAIMVQKRVRLTMDLVAALEESEMQSRFKSQFVAGTLLHPVFAAASVRNSAGSLAISTPTADMSHEIRTPMNGVLGITELMMDQPLSPIVREYATVIMSCGTLLAGLIDDILDFSKIAAGKVVLHSTPTSLRSVLFDAAQIMRSAYRPPPNASDVRFVLRISNSVPSELVDVDRTRLRQVVVNMVSNAFKFTDEGSIELSVSCSAEDENAIPEPHSCDLQHQAPGVEAERLPGATPGRCRGWSTPPWAWHMRIFARCLAFIDRTRATERPPKPHLQWRKWFGRTKGAGRMPGGEGGDRFQVLDENADEQPLDRPRRVRLVISVRDTGIGIPPEVLDKLFRPFVQGERTERSHAVGGTGLGLTISRSLCELMGGTMRCTSEVNVGTTFTCTLLVGLVDDANLLSQETNASTADPVESAGDMEEANGSGEDRNFTRWSWDLVSRPLSSYSSTHSIEGGRNVDKEAHCRSRRLIHCRDRSASGGSLSCATSRRVDAALFPTAEAAGSLKAAQKSLSVRVSRQTSDVRRKSIADSSPSGGKQLQRTEELQRSKEWHNLCPIWNSIEHDIAGKQPAILVVDDGRVNRLLLSRMLNELGVSVSTANDGESAVAASNEQKFSAILMDMCMPVMDGPKATEMIRQSNGPNAKTPIVFVTATASEEARSSCLLSGGTGFVTKPVSRHSIISKLAEYLPPEEVEWMRAAWMEKWRPADAYQVPVPISGAPPSVKIA